MKLINTRDERSAFLVASEDPLNNYQSLKRPELKALAEARGLKHAYKYKKNQLREWLQAHDAEAENAATTPNGAGDEDVREPEVKRERRVKRGAAEAKASAKASHASEKVEAQSKASAATAGAEGQAEAPHVAEEAGVATKATQDTPDAEGPSEHASTTPEVASRDAEASGETDVSGASQESHREERKKKSRRDLPSDSGVLEVMSDGYGFLRGENEDGSRVDYYLPAIQIRRFNLKSGDIINGVVGDAHERDRYAPIIFINEINGMDPGSYLRREDFDDLTPIYPDSRLRLETVSDGISNRIVDLVAPVGRGQRGLIVSPPKAGKTTLLKSIAQAIELTYPEIYLFILLIDERPEEVTDFEESVNRLRKADDPIRTEVVASTFDKQAQNHTKTAEELLERAKRLVESGQDVMILLDSLTRLSRAYNITTTPSGRTLSGGLDPVALYPPKSFFGAARNIRDAGSLTILATCLKDTGSRMDDMIYEEFKGTGNMEVHLSRNLSEMRIFPAIDIFASGTRRDDLLLTAEERNAMLEVRSQSRSADETAVMEQFVRLMKNTQTNEEFCRVILGNRDAQRGGSGKGESRSARASSRGFSSREAHRYGSMAEAHRVSRPRRYDYSVDQEEEG